MTHLAHNQTLHSFRILLLTILLLGLLPNYVSAGQASDVKVDLLNNFEVEIVELNGSREICSWVADNLEPKTWEINETHKWVNYRPSQLDSPKSYHGFIKHIYLDIDNDGVTEVLIRTQTYLGGTPSAFDIWINNKNPFTDSPVVLGDLSKTDSVSLKTEGRRQYLSHIDSLKKDGVEVVNNDDLLYGYLAYELQNRNQIFNYEGKNYIYLNAFHPSLSDGLGMVVEIIENSSSTFSVNEICFFRMDIKESSSAQ